MKICLRVFLWSPVVFGALLLCLWQWLMPWLLTQQIRAELSKQGITVEQLQYGRMGDRDLQFQHIRLIHDDTHMQIILRNFTLRFHLLELLQGNIAHIRADIDSAQLKLAANPSASAGYTLFSPLPLLGMLPIESLRIDELSLIEGNHQWHGKGYWHQGGVRLRLREQQQQHLQLALHLQQQGTLQAVLTDNKQALLRVNGTLSEDNNRLRLQAQLHAELGLFTQLQAQIQANGTLDSQLDFTIPSGTHGDQKSLLSHSHLRSRIQLNGRIQQFSTRLTARLNSDDGSILHWRILPESTLRMHQDEGDIQWSDISMRGNIQFTDHHMSALSIAKNSSVKVQKLRRWQLVLDGSHAKLTRQLRWLVDQQQLSPLSIKLSLPELTYDDIRLRFGNLHINSQQWDASHPLQLQIKSSAFSVRHPTFTLPARPLQLRIRQQKQWQMAADYHYRKSMPWHLQASFDADRLRFQAMLKLRLSTAWQDINALLPTLGNTFKSVSIDTGELSATAKVHGSTQHWQSNGTIDVDDWYGQWGKKAFSALQGKMRWRYADHRLSIPSMQWNMDQFDAGLLLHQCELKGSAQLMPRWKLQLQRLRLHTLGGVLQAADINVSEQGMRHKSDNRFQLSLRNISMQQLVELEQQQGITASGILDGVLPMRWGTDGLSMQQGSLQTRQPGGVIRYLGNAATQRMASENPGVQLAMDVLGNFHYQKLSAKADYHPDGRLLLGLHLKGNNPDYDHGRPVEFNLNIEENLLTLLKSLTLADEIGGQLDQRIQQRH